MIPTDLFVMKYDDITENYAMPSWNEFFDNLHESSDKTVTAYGPIFPESPTKASVVETSLDYFMKVIVRLVTRQFMTLLRSC